MTKADDSGIILKIAVGELTMKIFVPCLFFSLCSCACIGSILDVPETIDGRLVEGEYANLSVTLEGSEELFVIGGGGSD